MYPSTRNILGDCAEMMSLVWSACCNGNGRNFKLMVMNADYFWIIMAAVIVIAVVVQIIADKRKKK